MEGLDGFLGAVRTMLSKGKARVLGEKPHNQPHAGDGQPLTFDFEFVEGEGETGRPFAVRRFQRGGEDHVHVVE